MFTGIIERASPLVTLSDRPGGQRLTLDLGAIEGPSVAGSDPWGGLEIGESIAVDGCCLTLVEVAGTTLSFDVIEESLRCTNLGARRVGDRLNLERAMRLGDRLGGHYVSGHVDTTAPIVAIEAETEETRFTIDIPAGAPVRVIHKGSITIDGVSLTVAAVDRSCFTVALIPHTLEITNLSDRRVGDHVNLEMDQIGRWVESLLIERGSLPDASHAGGTP